MMNFHIRKILSCLIVVLASIQTQKVFAQQEPLSTMYMYNGISVNPAYTGTRNSLSMNAFHRQQWVGVEGAPKTSTFTFHTPIKYTNMSMGMSVISDDIGPVSDFYANFFYAYKVKLNRKLTLSLGLNVGLYNYNAYLDNLDPLEPDAALVNTTKTSFNGGAGAYLYGKRFYVGISSPKVFQPNLDGYRSDAANLRRHYYFTAGYVFRLSNGLDLKPSVLTKVVEGAPISQDFNLQLFMNETVSIGASYRINNAVALMFGFHVNEKLMLGYSYDLSTNSLDQYNTGSHEVVLTYDIRLKKSVVRSPRYF